MKNAKCLNACLALVGAFVLISQRANAQNGPITITGNQAEVLMQALDFAGVQSKDPNHDGSMISYHVDAAKCAKVSSGIDIFKSFSCSQPSLEDDTDRAEAELLYAALEGAGISPEGHAGTETVTAGAIDCMFTEAGGALAWNCTIVTPNN